MRLAALGDARRIEEICNDPAIRVWTACDGAPPCVGAPYVTPPSFSVIGAEGALLFKHLDGQRYAVHTNLLPHCRGTNAVDACAQAVRIAFAQTDAMELVTMVPAIIPQAAWMARRNGFRELFTRPRVWPVRGELYDMTFYSLTIDDWIARGPCVAAGLEFHRRLHGELGEQGHPTDPIHDSYVGAALEMLHANQVRKGVEVYNRFARFAGYQLLRVVSEEPLRIDIGQCVLRFEGDTFHTEARHA